jgi:DNA-binding MarR family transcriptional regulator
MTTSGLQRELKKQQPFVLLEQEALLNLFRSSDRLQIEFERLFRPFGLTAPQYNVLRILRGADEPLPVLEIASRTITVVPGTTGLVDRLEKLGFVARRRCTRDRRVIYVEITDTGREVLERLDEPLLQLHRKLLGHLTQAELRELIRLLEKVRQPVAGES